MSKRILGEEHPDTLVSMNNLASSYSDLGRRTEALGLGEKVLEMSKRILGEEHPDTLLYQDNLSIIQNVSPEAQLAKQRSDSRDEDRKSRSKWNPKRWIKKHEGPVIDQLE